MKKKKNKSERNDEIHKAFTGKDTGKRNAEEIPERQGPDPSHVKKAGRYEPDKDESGSQGAFGQGNRISKGSEGAQGYGKYEE